MVPHYALLEPEARRYLETLFPTRAAGEQTELRWKPPKDGFMCREFFSNPQEVLHAASHLMDAHDVFLGVAPRQGKIGTKAGVSRLLAIWADLDTKQGHTRETRSKQITDLPYPPSMMVWSGAGLHVYWALGEPTDGEEELVWTEALMRRLAEGLEGDPVWDRARILRLPGTLNHKYDKPRRVELIHCDHDKRYTLGQLWEMADVLPTKGTRRNRLLGRREPSTRICVPEMEGLGLAPNLSRLPRKAQDLIRHGNRGEYRSRSEADMAVCVAMIRVGYGLDEVWTVMTSPENGISQKYFEKGVNGEAYLELTIQKAHEFANAKRERRGRVYARKRRGVSID
jgi:hypothetical protein